MLVELTTIKLATGNPPIVTAVAPVKFTPIIAMEVPPNVDPLDGEKLDIIGGTTI